MRRQPTPDAEVVAGRVIAELAGILEEVKKGARLLYDGLPVHCWERTSSARRSRLI